MGPRESTPRPAFGSAPPRAGRGRDASRADGRTTLKVVHISTATSGGGAARIARALHLRQLELGLHSTLLCGRGHADPSRSIFTLGVGRGRHLSNVLIQRLTGREGALNRRLWTTASRRFVDAADVVHLHNAHGYYLPLPVLEGLAAGPLVWSLKDEWLMTGRCAFPLECRGFADGCAPCPHLGRYPAAWIDRAGAGFHSRRRLVEHSRAQFVTPSQATRERFVAAGFPAARVAVIPNPLRLRGQTSPRARAEARSALGFPDRGGVLLFVAAQSWNPRKGLAVLAEAIRRLRRPEAWQLCVVGEPRADVRALVADLRVETRIEGRIDEGERLAAYYTASDALVAPSTSETFGNTVLEAASMGCRVVCTDLAVFRETLGDLGRYFPVGDGRACAEKLDELSAEGCPPLPPEAVGALRERFSAERIATAYVARYEDALRDVGPGAQRR